MGPGEGMVIESEKISQGSFLSQKKLGNEEPGCNILKFSSILF
jgi:hypothetical protein